MFSLEHVTLTLKLKIEAEKKKNPVKILSEKMRGLHSLSL